MEQKSLKDALHSHKLPRAVREAFNAKRFSDVVLYPAPTQIKGQPESGCVRCNSSALAAASPLMKRLLSAADPAQGSLSVSLDCSLTTLRQLAMFAHRGATDMIDEDVEEEFRKWAKILEINAAMSRESSVKEMVNLEDGLVSDELSKAQTSHVTGETVFKCPFCLGKPFHETNVAMAHLREHKASLDHKRYFKSLPARGSYLSLDFICPVCEEVPLSAGTTMDADARQKCYQHNRECRQNIERMLEELISKHYQPSTLLITPADAPKESGNGSNNNIVGVAPCDGCGKAFKSNIARKKHMEKCEQTIPSGPNLAKSVSNSAKDLLRRFNKDKETNSSSADETVPKKPKSQPQRKEIKCPLCEEVFPTKEGLRLHTCDDGERSKMDTDGILDERTARKVRPEAGALKEPSLDLASSSSGAAKKRRKKSGDSRSSESSSSHQSFRVVNISKRGGGGGVSMNNSRVTESSLTKQIEKFRQETPQVSRKRQAASSLSSNSRRKSSSSDEDDDEDENDKDDGDRRNSDSSSKNKRARVEADELSSESSDSDDAMDKSRTESAKRSSDKDDEDDEDKIEDPFDFGNEMDVMSDTDEEDSRPMTKEKKKMTPLAKVLPKPKPAKAKRGGASGSAPRPAKKKLGPKSRISALETDNTSASETLSDINNFVNSTAPSNSNDKTLDMPSSPPFSALSPGPVASANSHECAECGASFNGNSALFDHASKTKHKIYDDDDDDETW